MIRTKLSFYFILFFTACAASIAAVVVYIMRPAVGPETFPKTAILTFPVREGRLPLEQPKRLRIVTYNIGYAAGGKVDQGSVLAREEVIENLDAIVSVLAQLNADVICLQEVDFESARSFDINQLDYLAKRLEFPYAAYVINWNKRYVPWPYWPPAKHFGRIVSGQVILSRYPLANQETFFFKKPISNPFWYNWGYIDRVAQRVTLQFGSKPVAIWNVHLEAYDSEVRLRQIGRLSEEVLKDNDRVVLVAGDFNSVSYFKPDLSPAEKEELEDSGKGVKSFIKETRFKNAERHPRLLSLPSWDPIKKIDHIFYKGLTLKDSGNSPDIQASDHLPVWAEFELE